MLASAPPPAGKLKPTISASSVSAPVFGTLTCNCRMPVDSCCFQPAGAIIVNLVLRPQVMACVSPPPAGAGFNSSFGAGAGASPFGSFAATGSDFFTSATGAGGGVAGAGVALADSPGTIGWGPSPQPDIRAIENAAGTRNAYLNMR